MAPNPQMENSGFELDTEKGEVEMSDVKRNGKDTTQTHSCKPDLCRGMYASYLKDRKKMAVNPWDRLKTVFLVGIIVVLFLWILVYVVTSRLGWL
ncbi:uncharacterized protein LOC124353055 isoform X2 [Homalodisca vitripennis]|uniref:uncharacterized protein LOC124353055 isoform X2 n=1 Tax=Homalodisca vitripennis TaxID=197043 RepID=UPI001EEA6FD2|nr:uncharacterized protein LOC124353055 isoform X2 [Homalodisca vitripennis]